MLVEAFIAQPVRSTGFDYLRLGLAVSILAATPCIPHLATSHYEEPIAAMDHRLLLYSWPCVFALSGFMVAGKPSSAVRTLQSRLRLSALSVTGHR